MKAGLKKKAVAAVLSLLLIVGLLPVYAVADSDIPQTEAAADITEKDAEDEATVSEDTVGEQSADIENRIETSDEAAGADAKDEAAGADARDEAAGADAKDEAAGADTGDEAAGIEVPEEDESISDPEEAIKNEEEAEAEAEDTKDSTEEKLMDVPEEVDPEISMVEGDVIRGYVAAGAACVSSDPAVAWVDGNGDLNALKIGSATISVTWPSGATGESLVTVSDYQDGSEVVGKLKLLARFNDSMDFYDGHTYLLFTSYQDQVEISVPDLYGGYEISDLYYKDIREDIANGSNHTGSDAEKYFTFKDDLTSITLDRGEIVTIGMYRGFDLTIADAALGTLKNSSIWTSVVNAGKAAIVENLFRLFGENGISAEAAFEELEAIFKEQGLDLYSWTDGVVEGGVCFNRELYNQKLEWDQFENVTYELDITRNQLDALVATLSGNLNRFNVINNSCATVALNAWNAAVGTRDGADTAYKLEAASDGIYSFMDAPGGVRDNIVRRLPGYYLNNSEGVEEPDACFRDETGYVYVSAPEIVNTFYQYAGDASLFLDESENDMTSLVNIAGAGSKVVYNADDQIIEVDVKKQASGDASVVTGIVFTVNGEEYTIDENTILPEGIWFRTDIGEPEEGVQYYAADADGRAIPSKYADGEICFRLDSFPGTFKIAGKGQEASRHVLKTTAKNADKAEAEVTVFTMDGSEKKILGETDEAAAGTRIYISSRMDSEQEDYFLSDIRLNGDSIMDDDHVAMEPEVRGGDSDKYEVVYYFDMPAKYSRVVLDYEEGKIQMIGSSPFQVFAGDEINISDHAALTAGPEWGETGNIRWIISGEYDEDNNYIDEYGTVLEYKDDFRKVLTAKGPGTAVVVAYAAGNPNIGLGFMVEVLSAPDDYVKVTYSDDNRENIGITALAGDGSEEIEVPYSGYYVRRGSELAVRPVQEESIVISRILCNGRTMSAGKTVVAQEDVSFDVKFREAVIKGMPKSVNLKTEGESFQLNARVKYTGLAGILPVFDPSIRYESADPLVSVDENGLITVTGEIPEGGRAVYVTAYAGSSNDCVFAVCKVTAGDYQGDKIVGRATIFARAFSKVTRVPHGSFTFTTYEDIDLNVSCNIYREPNEKYKTLMRDWEDHPENYSSDPALWNYDDLGIGDRSVRETYFTIHENGAFSEPETISLKTGETITVSNYTHGGTGVDKLIDALDNSTLVQNSKDARELLEELRKYARGEGLDETVFFDSGINTIAQVYAWISGTGNNPIDSVSAGGLEVDSEMFYQFVNNYSLLPNNYYTVELTADEVAAMAAYLSNPANNYYSLTNLNCASGAVNLWNTVVADKADRVSLTLSSNLTGFAQEPVSLYFEIGLLNLKKGLEGESGSNFVPHTIESRHKWSVSAKDNTLEAAACVNRNIEHHNGECDYRSEPCVLSIEAADADKCSFSNITLNGVLEFNAVTGKDVAANADYIKFYRTDKKGETTGGVEVPEGTAEAGFYYAELTVDGMSIRDAFVIADPRKEQDITVKASASRVAAGKTASVTVTGAKTNVTFTSSDKSIAAVNNTTGKITAKKIGYARITVKAAASDKYKEAKKSIVVKVVPGKTESVSVKKSGNGFRISWKAVDGAAGYYIYRNGKMIKKTVKASTTAYTDTNKAVNGAKYIYKIKAYANTGVSTLYNETTIYYLTTPKAPALTVTKVGNIKVSWKKNSKCDGYIIRYSRNKEFSTYETAVVNSSSTLTKVLKNTESGKRYYVQIRSFKKDQNGRKYYSAWSAESRT